MGRGYVVIKGQLAVVDRSGGLERVCTSRSSILAGRHSCQAERRIASKSAPIGAGSSLSRHLAPTHSSPTPRRPSAITPRISIPSFPSRSATACRARCFDGPHTSSKTRGYSSPRRQEQAEATRNRIMEAFASRTGRPGAFDISVTEAAREAGVSDGPSTTISLIVRPG